MSNKKRISKRVKIIQSKVYPKITIRMRMGISLGPLTKAVNKFKKAFEQLALAYENVRSKEPERIIDSHGDEMVIPKFEIKHHPYFLHKHKSEQS